MVKSDAASFITSDKRRGKLPPALKRKKITKNRSQNKTRCKAKLGKHGEQQAAAFLTAKNYQILQKNFRALRKEIDLIALDQSTQEIVFVEVKTRSSGNYGHPSLAVNQAKLKNIFLAAQIFLQDSGLDNDYRFDIISILPSKVEHFKNITW